MRLSRNMRLLRENTANETEFRDLLEAYGRQRTHSLSNLQGPSTLNFLGHHMQSGSKNVALI